MPVAPTALLLAGTAALLAIPMAKAQDAPATKARASATARETADAPAADEPMARFRALPPLRKAMVVSTAVRQLEADPDPLLRGILAARTNGDALPALEPLPIHDPKRWAPVAPARTLVASGSPRHRTVRAEVPEVPFLPDLHREVVYDWTRGKVARAATLGYDELFENLLHGYPPGADAAVAGVLQALDRNPGMRPLAEFFGHAYADRDGHVFEGIPLYEAWYSGEIIEMPDVDAIAFAVRVLDDRSFTSPILADARRNALYETMQQKALVYRKYRTMLEAAAAARIRAEPRIDATYAPLVSRFHLVFQACGEDLSRVAKLLGDLNGDREQLIALVDTAARLNPAAFEQRDARQRQLAAMADRVRAAALAALE